MPGPYDDTQVPASPFAIGSVYPAETGATDPALAAKFLAQHRADMQARQGDINATLGGMQSSTDQLAKILDDTTEAIKASRQGQSNLPLMAMAAGLLSSRGNFGQQLGAGFQAVIPTVQKEREQDQQMQMQLAGLALKKAAIEQGPLEAKLAYYKALQTGDITAARGIESALIRSQAMLGGIGAVEPSQSDVHGDDYLKTLPPAFSATVKGIAEGRMPMPTGFLLKSPYGQALMTALSRYEPGFEGTDYGARYSTAKAFASGKEAQSIRAANQAIQHLGVLHQAGAALNNTDYPLLNSGLNALATAGGSSNASNFLAAAHPVAEEVSKIFKGSNLSDTEVRSWEKSLSPNMSPEQMQGALKTITNLMDGALDALGTQYKKTMGKNLNPLTDKSKATLDFIENHPLDAAKSQTAPQSTLTLPPHSSMAGARKAPDGNWYVPDPNRLGKYLMVK